MRPGALRHKLTLEAPTRTGDGGGGAEVSWSPVDEVWARIEARSGAETVTAEKRASRLSHTVTLRWRADLDPTQRLRLGARVLEIEAVSDPDGRRRWLQCRCTERVNP